jgi:hypothetical protein
MARQTSNIVVSAVFPAVTLASRELREDMVFTLVTGVGRALFDSFGCSSILFY